MHSSVRLLPGQAINIDGITIEATVFGTFNHGGHDPLPQVRLEVASTEAPRFIKDADCETECLQLAEPADDPPADDALSVVAEQ